jgi:glycogen debranching enzyme
MGQPYLDQHVTCVRAPATWLSPPDGQLRGGVDGLYVADRRVLSRLIVCVSGAEPVPLVGTAVTADRARFVGVLRGLGDPGPDPTVWCERVRVVRADGGDETIVVRNASRAPVRVTVEVLVGADLAPVGLVKTGQRPPPVAATVDGADLVWQDNPVVRLTAEPLPTVDTSRAALRWDVDVPPGEWTATLSVTCEPAATTGYRPLAPVTLAPWHQAPLTVTADDHRLDRLVAASVADLTALRLADGAGSGGEPTDEYAAAGSPWYLTLFARDSLWTATLGLPLGPELAAGTLRALARRQGVRVDPHTEEAPGKIPHELRPTDAAVGLPPVYYGTVDATPLFVVLLGQAWRWGMPAEEVAALLPAVHHALGWLTTHEDFIAYAPVGHGLVNHGWKDSADGVQHADGRLARPPVALAEVQAYAFRAALAGADLFDAFGEDGGLHWRGWAADLASRFRSAYWVSDVDGPYPAIALEAGGKPVDGPSSNMGHLLGTGLLDAGEEALVARRLAGPALMSGYGLRTLADTAAGFNPLSYHAGSVWPHDTAIAALGLVRAGHPGPAAALLSGLLAAAEAFDYRLPELYGGFAAAAHARPVPYPAACRPQAWAAAAGPAFVPALLGLDVDVPARRVRLDPIAPSPVGAYDVSGIRIGPTDTLSVRVDAAGRVTRTEAPQWLRLEVADG